VVVYLYGMGISDFYALIKEHCPHVLITMKLSDLAGISVAVDISIFLNKYVKSAGEVRWMDTFIVLLCTLKKHGIKPVCIFDGPNPPVEKKQEQERRRAEAAKKRDRIDRGKALVKKLNLEFIPKSKSLKDELKEEIRTIIGPKRNKTFSVNYDDVHDVYACLKDSVEKMERQNLPILPEYTVKAKQIIEIMGFSHFQADGEAEALCSGMCHLGYVHAVLSEDTDVLAIGAPFLLSKIDLSTQTVVAISYADILSSLGMNSDEFRDLCILLGCDYNDRVKGYPPDGKNRKKPVGIGAKGAFWMINEYRRLEIAEQYMVDADPLNYRRCRELFTPPDDLSHITVPYSGPINKDALIDFLEQNDIRTNQDYILSAWKPAILKFHYPEIHEIKEDIEEITEVEGEENIADADFLEDQ
jgi:flap endonuclease-1